MQLAPSARRSRVSSLALAATVGCAFTLTSCSNMEDVNKVNPTRLGVAAQLESFSDSLGSAVDQDRDNIGIDLDGGHRISDGLEVGALLSWSREETDLDFTTPTGVVGTSSTLEQLLLGPQVRYYLIPEGQVQPWVTVSAGLADIEQESNSTIPGSEGSEKLSENGTFVQGGVGVSYFASRWVAIEGSLQFSSLSIDEIDTEGTTLQIGLSVFF